MTTDPTSTPQRRSALVLALALTLPAAALFASAGIADVALNALVGFGAVAACALAGAPLVKWLALPGLGPAERALLSLGAGTTALSLLMLALGAAGLLRPWAVLLTTVAAAGAGVAYTRPWRAMAAAWEEAARLFDDIEGALLVVGLFLVLTLLLAASVVPVWDWDSLMYHLPVPGAWLREGRIFRPPDQAHAALAGLVHMLYVIPLACARVGGVVVLSGALALALALAVGTIVARERDVTTGRLAVAGLAGTSILYFVAVTPRIDVTLALLLLLAHWAVVRVASGGSPRWLLVAALFGGAAIATKVSAGAYLVPLAGWCVWLLVRGRLRGPVFLQATAVALVVMAPWLVKNAVLTGDPLHPILSGPAFPAWLMEHAPVAAAADGVHTDLISRSRAPIGLRALLLTPERLSPEPGAFYYVWSPLLLLGAFLVLLRPGTWRWALPAAVYVAILLLRSERTNLRYLIPAVPALSVASALALRGLVPWPRVRRWVMGAVLLASMAFLIVPFRAIQRWIRHPGGGRPYYSIYAAAAGVSQRVPPDGLVLMLYEGRSWPFDRPVIQDNLALTWPLLAESGQAESCLRDLGTPITHVLINIGALAFYTAGAGGAQHVSDGALDRFVGRCLGNETTIGPFRLYTLSRTSAGGPAGGDADEDVRASGEAAGSF